ncbi:MAG: hypothetical protein F4X18_02430 [Acidimicrobiia bacterium]|nr:hypothetical protein [Acidimicrobiia bacterium]
MAEAGLTLALAWWVLEGALLGAGAAAARATPVVVGLAGAAVIAGLVGLSIQRLPSQSWETTRDDVLVAAAIRQRVQFALAAGSGVGCLVLAGAVAAVPPTSGLRSVVGVMMSYLAATTAVSLLRVVGEFPSGVVGSS